MRNEKPPGLSVLWCSEVNRQLSAVRKADGGQFVEGVQSADRPVNSSTAFLFLPPSPFIFPIIHPILINHLGFLWASWSSSVGLFSGAGTLSEGLVSFESVSGDGLLSSETSPGEGRVSFRGSSLDGGGEGTGGAGLKSLGGVISCPGNPWAGSVGCISLGSTRWTTAPDPPNRPWEVPLRKSSTPPAFPRVMENLRRAVQVDVSLGWSRTSLTCRSSATIRIQVFSVATALKTWRRSFVWSISASGVVDVWNLSGGFLPFSGWGDSVFPLRGVSFEGEGCSNGAGEGAPPEEAGGSDSGPDVF